MKRVSIILFFILTGCSETPKCDNSEGIETVMELYYELSICHLATANYMRDNPNLAYYANLAKGLAVFSEDLTMDDIISSSNEPDLDDIDIYEKIKDSISTAYKTDNTQSQFWEEIRIAKSTISLNEPKLINVRPHSIEKGIQKCTCLAEVKTKTAAPESIAYSIQKAEDDVWVELEILE